MTLNIDIPQYTRNRFIVKARQHQLGLGVRTNIMGIINVTPDSFSRDGCMSVKNFTQSALRRARQMVREGCDILDIGGESTRPGAQAVPVQEEIDRVIPVIREIVKHTAVPVSIDTYKTEVARQALDAGASIVNVIKGIRPPQALLKAVRDYDAGIVLMHMKGTPRTMQRQIHYAELITDIKTALQQAAETCLETGIANDKIILDPGIGFGKTAEDNLTILNRLTEFHELGFPILIGTSRKSFIGKVLNKEVEHRAFGTAASVSAAIMNGAHIIRVHDVKEMRDAAMVADAILNRKILNTA